VRRRAVKARLASLFGCRVQQLPHDVALLAIAASDLNVAVTTSRRWPEKTVFPREQEVESKQKDCR
jgi:hypothetical protein